MIETGEEEEILDEFSLFELLTVEDTSVVDDLPKQLDGGLCSVGLHEGHVQIIDKSNQSLVHSRTISLT